MIIDKNHYYMYNVFTPESRKLKRQREKKKETKQKKRKRKNPTLEWKISLKAMNVSLFYYIHILPS